MFDKYTKKANARTLERLENQTDKYTQAREESAIRFLSMQSVINKKLAQGQASVDNAENYPSTWTTNPDGGANGQV